MLLPFAFSDTPYLINFDIARAAVELIELLAVIVIAIGVVAAIVSGGLRWMRTTSREAFETFKRYMARGLLLRPFHSISG